MAAPTIPSDQDVKEDQFPSNNSVGFIPRSTTHTPIKPRALKDGALLPDASKTAIFLQEKCFLHRFIRTKDASGIVERPERLRAVALGLAAALARLKEETNPGSSPRTPPDEAEQLVRALSQLDISATDPASFLPSSCRVVHSSASPDLLSHLATRFVHATKDGHAADGFGYLDRIHSWASESESKIADGGSEIPEGYLQGDLYLCPGSIDAMRGAVGTVCEAVDEVMGGGQGQDEAETRRAFVAIRPPGHHCGEDTPAGFCFVNNVAIGAMHAHINHGIDRIVIFDIDLHHGNGTQKIAWAINAATHRKELGDGNQEKTGPKIFYGSLHDVLSYPCEDGDADLVRDASVSIGGAHGQFVTNVHLRTYASDGEFHADTYTSYYSRLFGEAKAFLEATAATQETTAIFISCGFDACEHEHDYMSRHGRKVPVSFYERFAQDARDFADTHSGGKLISILEGGYSDRALISGAMAHLAGLAGRREEGGEVWRDTRADWWCSANLTRFEKMLKKPKGRKPRVSGQGVETQDPWLTRTQEIFFELDRVPIIPATRIPPAVRPPHMTLRDRSRNQPTSGQKPGSKTGHAAGESSGAAQGARKARTSLNKQAHADPLSAVYVGASARADNGTKPEGFPSDAPVPGGAATGEPVATSSNRDVVETGKPTPGGTAEPPQQPLMIKIKIPRAQVEGGDAGLK